MRKILVLRGGALGDFIVTLPALDLLRRRWPDARIELIGNATAAALALTRGLLDAAYSQHEARWSALFSTAPLPAALAAWLGSFDLVLSYWPDGDHTLRRHFPVREQQAFLWAEAMPVRAPAAAHYCEPLRRLGLEASTFVFPLVPAGRPWPAAVAPTAPIALHPGSGSPRKNWPLDRWLELIAKLPAPLLLILGEAEHERWDQLSPNFGARVSVLHQAPLETLVAELAPCRVFLGHDSGISHLAAACGVPCRLIFGPTDPKIWAPPAPHVHVLQRGADLAQISVADVLAVVAQEAPRTKVQAPENRQSPTVKS